MNGLARAPPGQVETIEVGVCPRIYRRQKCRRHRVQLPQCPSQDGEMSREVGVRLVAHRSTLADTTARYDSTPLPGLSCRTEQPDVPESSSWETSQLWSAARAVFHCWIP